MSSRDDYQPGPATGAHIQKEGEKWTLVLARELRHSPEVVWDALTDPNELREWAPFDTDRNLTSVGPVTLSTVGTESPQVNEGEVLSSRHPELLEYTWGGGVLRWELEATAEGTKLTLWHNIDKRFIAMGAAGWHVCLDVLDRFLLGAPIGRIVAGDALQFPGWQRLLAEYSAQFGVEMPKWS